MQTSSTSVPQDTYKPDDFLDITHEWEQSDIACPKCGSKNTWEAEIGDKLVLECDDCDYHVEE